MCASRAKQGRVEAAEVPCQSSYFYSFTTKKKFNMAKPIQNLTIACTMLWLLTVQLRCYGDYWFMDALLPVYADSLKIHQVVIEPPRSLRNTAKIYYKDSIIYIIERDSGIHVVDNRQPATPKPIRFIKMRGCEDIAIKSTFLYADNFTDLVVLDIKNPNAPTMVRRLSGMYPTTEDGKPALRYRTYGGASYQCADPAKGKVIAWAYGQLDTTKCYKRF
jgi:hypothetical protein